MSGMSSKDIVRTDGQYGSVLMNLFGALIAYTEVFDSFTAFIDLLVYACGNPHGCGPVHGRSSYCETDQLSGVCAMNCVHLVTPKPDRLQF
jgi:hypothetical protein